MFTKQHMVITSTNIALMLAALNCLSQPTLADSKSMTSVKPSTVRTRPSAVTHTTHRSSIGVATLHVYTKTSELKNDGLIRHLLKSAVGADSPDSNPDGEDRSAATINLDVNETLTASLFRQNTFDLDQLKDLEKEDIILGSLTRDSVLHLNKGNALFVPKKDITVRTDLAEINIGAGSMVGVLRPSADVVSIYDLEDSGGKKVSIKVGNEKLTLSPGKHLVLSKEANEFEKINPAHRIAYRKVESRKMQTGIYAYTSEFSISSAVLHIKPLQNILLSKDPEDRKIAGRLLKNFVILEDVYGDAEPYKMPANIVAPVKISNK